MRLSVLDQSPVTTDGDPIQALQNTVDLCKRVDGLGYHRFWVAEHHNDEAFSHSAPEVLIPHLASVTDQIRVGAGGVLLGHYSPYKVAEQFNLLTALFPDRIDLGIGRAGGGEGRSSHALRPDGPGAISHWQKISHLLSYLGQGLPQNKPFPAVFAQPVHREKAPVWILGTSPASARFAADNGLPYAFGGFIDPRHLTEAMATYHQHFQPSRWLDAPHSLLAWVALAAESEADAEALSRSVTVWFIRTFVRGGTSRFPTDAEAHDEKLSPQEELIAGFRKKTSAIGTAEQVLEALDQVQRQLRVDELALVTLTADHHARVRSYELLAPQAL